MDTDIGHGPMVTLTLVNLSVENGMGTVSDAFERAQDTFTFELHTPLAPKRFAITLLFFWCVALPRPPFRRKGTMVYGTGAHYEGSWTLNSRQGRKCTLVLADGSEYVGDFWKNKMHGHGVMRSADGSIYQGQWESGVKNGRGVLTVNNVETTGTWLEGKLSTETPSEDT